MLLTGKFAANFKKPFNFVQGKPFNRTQGKEKRAKIKREDVVTAQVKSLLQTSDQKLIVMVRG